MPVPTVEEIRAYLAFDQESHDDDQLAIAYAAEKANQAQLCLVPADGAAWPADLANALMRRVAHNLEVRKNPGGYEFANSEFGTTSVRVGGRDLEVERLEAPYRVIAIA